MRHLLFISLLAPFAFSTACDPKVVLGDLPDDGGVAPHTVPPIDDPDSGSDGQVPPINGPDSGSDGQVSPINDPDSGGTAPDAGSDAPVYDPWDASLPPNVGICVGDDAGAADTGTADTGTPDADAEDASACGCSRRGSPSVDCPRGTGLIAATVIGPAGGTLEADMGGEGPTSVQFPAGSLSAPTTITFIQTTDPPPHDILDWSPVFLVEPLGLTFAGTAVVSFPWQNEMGAIPSGLQIWYSPDGSCFAPLPDQTGNAGFITANVTSLGGYYITGVARSSATAACP